MLYNFRRRDVVSTSLHLQTVMPAYMCARVQTVMLPHYLQRPLDGSNTVHMQDAIITPLDGPVRWKVIFTNE